MSNNNNNNNKSTQKKLEGALLIKASQPAG
jgi:hypothetical protein